MDDSDDRRNDPAELNADDNLVVGKEEADLGKATFELEDEEGFESSMNVDEAGEVAIVAKFVID